MAWSSLALKSHSDDANAWCGHGLKRVASPPDVPPLWRGEGGVRRLIDWQCHYRSKKFRHFDTTTLCLPSFVVVLDNRYLYLLVIRSRILKARGP